MLSLYKIYSVLLKKPDNFTGRLIFAWDILCVRSYKIEKWPKKHDGAIVVNWGKTGGVERFGQVGKEWDF